MAPVNRIPSEILTLIPDFWHKYGDGRDRDLVALTHVCRAWREMFTSRSSLWADMDCKNYDRARVYLERSKSLPINLSLHADNHLPSHHPFFEIIPHAIGRLRSLFIEGPLEDLRGITDHTPRPAPLLEKLLICGDHHYKPHLRPVVAPALFGGDLSSLCSLGLRSVRTELPWRNMVNLTSFKLHYMSLGEVSIGQLLDFLESAPRLRKANIYEATPTSGAQNGRLVSLPCLKRMEITGGGSASPLLDHLLIPVGARLEIEVELPSPPIKDRPPRFLDNLRNLPNFTKIELDSGGSGPQMELSGPNGQIAIIAMIPRSSQVDKTCLILESLDHFDTSKVEQLETYCGDSPSSDPPYRALLPMEHLRVLTLDHCASPHTFIHALHPAMSLSGTVVCPELEELVIVLGSRTLDVRSVIGAAAARASRGAKLKSVKIVGQDKLARIDVLELKKHVLDVECGPEVDETDGDGGGIGEQD